MFAIGCAPHESSGRRTLILWGLQADDKGLQAVVRQFEAMHPDVHVKVLNMGAGGLNPQKLMTSIVGKVPPDLIYQDRFTVSDWASRGAFESLDKLIAVDRKRDPLCPTPEKYYPAAWNEACYENRVYGIPTRVDDRAFYYNKKIFREHAEALRQAGLDPDRAPRTWSELLAYSKVLTTTNPDGSPKTFGFVPNFGNSWLYLYALQNNANFISRDGKTCTLDSKEAEEALAFMKKGYDIIGGYERFNAYQSGALGKENDPFVSGQIAMKIDGDWILNDLSKFGPTLELGVAPPPVPDDRFNRSGRFAAEKDVNATWSGGFCYSIPTGAKHIGDAWNFIKWACSKEAALMDAREQSSWERLEGRAFIPRQSANIEANEALFKEFKPADKKFADALKVHIQLMPASKMRPPTFAGQLLWDEHVRAVENACTGRMTVKEALLDGQRKVQRELDQVYGVTRYPEADLRIPVAIASVLIGLGLWRWFAWYHGKRLGLLAAQEARWAFAFVSPWLFGFAALTLGPMLASFYLSFTQFNVLSPARWIGGRNYADIVTTDRAYILKALANAAYLAGFGVPLSILTGLAVALLLNAAVRGMAAYRTLFYMPAIVPSVASAVLWWWLLTPDPQRGLVNAAWMATVGTWLHLDPPGWVTAEAWSKPALILMGMWGAGSGMILWLAGLKGIPASLYEAAGIDGANPRQQFWCVTLPHLTPLIFFNVVMGFIGAFQEFDRVYVLTVGSTFGPGDSLLTPVYLLFNNGFSYFRMGFASALAWVIFLIILILTLVQFRLAPRWVHYEADK